MSPLLLDITAMSKSLAMVICFAAGMALGYVASGIRNNYSNPIQSPPRVVISEETTVGSFGVAIYPEDPISRADWLCYYEFEPESKLVGCTVWKRGGQVFTQSASFGHFSPPATLTQFLRSKNDKLPWDADRELK